MKQVHPELGMSSLKRQKLAPDRFSDLPDDLLRDVMFFLTLQEAVQTCLLSRRWQNVWESMMWLNFDAAKFRSMKTFKKFVDNFLMYRSSLLVPVPLDAFWIFATCNSSDDSLDYSDIHPWICHALASNAWALGIMKHSGNKLLSMEGYPFPFISVHLKLLHLCHFSIDDCFVKNLTSGCPVLDDLELVNCAINVTMFCSTILKSLTITSTHTDEDFPKEFQHLVIDMPNLVDLRLEEIPRRNIHLVDVSLVERASIYFFSLSFENSNVDCNIVSALSNATRLELVSPSVFEDVVPKVLQRDLPRCETFSNLKHLKLGEWFLRGGCYPLLYLLHRSPCIETVVLQLDESGVDDYDDVRFPNAEAEVDPPCKETEITFSCEKLRRIEVYCPQGEKRAKIILRILSAHLSPLPEIEVKPIKD
ncbi:hypothetical protein ACP70R_008275 [Stipagrostis hirtigluma subsp. patula]